MCFIYIFAVICRTGDHNIEHLCVFCHRRPHLPVISPAEITSWPRANSKCASHWIWFVICICKIWLSDCINRFLELILTRFGTISNVRSQLKTLRKWKIEQIENHLSIIHWNEPTEQNVSTAKNSNLKLIFFFRFQWSLCKKKWTFWNILSIGHHSKKEINCTCFVCFPVSQTLSRNDSYNLFFTTS